VIATEYAPLARRTLKELPREQHFIHMALGLCGEIGEFIDAVKKNVIYGKPLDLVNLTEEAGDDFWYAANLLEELAVHHAVLQRSIDQGYAQGTQMEQAAKSDPWELATALLAVNLNIATVSVAIANAPEKFLPGSSEATQVIESVGATLGLLCGLYKLDPTLAMDLNIKKLAKRYGDKFSDVAALNRDTAAERVILEGTGTQGA
jgi:NTP pyrophosphatase (non-canonical NTP hydrolase)